MELLRLMFRNFRSYGNKWVDIKFSCNNGIYLIYGDNGSGKSSIKYAIDYALFGKMRNIISDVVNKVNKRDCEVYLFLFKNDKYFVIMRGDYPQYVGVVELMNLEEVYSITDKDLKKRMKKVTQKDIDKILEINSNIYNNCISISINNFKSYINLSLDEKRKIIDKLFFVDILNDIYNYYKEEYKSIEAVKLKVETEIKDIDLYINQLKNIFTEKIEKNNYDLNLIIGKIEKLKKNYENLTMKLNDLNVISLNIKKELDDLNVEKGKLYNEILSINGKLLVLSNEKCPTCGSDLKTDIVKEQVEKLKKDRDKLKVEYENLKKKIIDLNEDYSKMYKLNGELYSQREDINYKINELEKICTLNFDNEKYKNLIEENEKIKNEKIKVLKELEQKEKFYYNLLKVFSETGVKSYMLSKVSVMINEIIEHLREKLNLKYKVILEPDFSVSIYFLGEKVNYFNFSTGEIRKIDILLILSFLKYLKNVYPINFVFLDEIFSSLDNENVNDILDVLKQFSEYMNISFYLISPVYIDYKKFNKIFFVEKKNGFSILNEVKV